MPRSRSGTIARPSERTGTEPMTARSVLGLRLLLASAAMLVSLVATVLFALRAASSGPGASPGATELAALAWACGLLTLTAAIDLVVSLRRRSRERPPPAG
ncbi:DUF6343 family protein [Streptomyces sp. NPDC059909]|uniref:DUF6343 family protein n=1 Tax=Streptomyces sp. NPDC059909 TaxID=3346998 RepID=UPI00365BE4A1